MRPIFIVGVPRSGTTVFSNKLAEATGIAMAPETHFMPEVYAKLKELDLADDSALDKAIAKFQSGRWFDALELESEQIKSSFRNLKQQDWASLFAVILQLYAHKNGAERWGEKTPGHYLFVSELLSWYDDCYIIFMIRDPRAVVASNMHAPFAPSYAWFVARRWRHVWDIYQSVAYDPRVFMVRYEDFVTAPEHVLADVKHRLGINAKLATAALPAAAGTTGQQGWRIQHLQTAAGAVNAKSLERWRDQLSPYDIWVTERYAGAGSVECGYEPVSAKGGHWRHRLKYLTCFPKQRLALAIEAAARVVGGGAKPNQKQLTLLMIGVVIDGFNLLNASRKQQLGRHDGKYAVIHLGSKHRGKSSFQKLSAEGETLGLFVIALYNLGYKINLTAPSRDQYFVAKTLVQAFGLGQCTVITLSPGAELEQNDLVEIYWLGRDKPAHITENLDIDPANAKKSAERIDALTKSEFVEQDINKGRYQRVIEGPEKPIRVYYFGVFVEYKYRKVIEQLPVEYIPTNYVGILKGLLFRKHEGRRLIVHLRYIQFHGYIMTAILYCVLALICKLRGARIVWSCHNIYEHGVPSLAYGDFLRGMLCRASSRVIVFHSSLKKYLHQCANKVEVANFGNYKEFILDPSLEKHPEFLQTYRSWLEKMGRHSADIVFIGEYKARKNVDMLVEFARENRDAAVLIIAHRTPPIADCPTNLLLHNRSKIFGELDEVLRGEYVTGFVAHDNLSVPTSIHLYADYDVPILGLDVEPVSCFIKDYACGVTFSSLDSLERAFFSLKTGREAYTRGMKKLAADNTWEKSAQAHCRAFEILPNTQYDQIHYYNKK